MDIAHIHAILIDCISRLSDDDPAVTVKVWISVPLRETRVRESEAIMIELLKGWPQSHNGVLLPALGEEISYFVAGDVLESRKMAFYLFAFGSLLDWWDILSPTTVLGLDSSDHRAQNMVAMGYLSIKGYKPAKISP